MPLRDTDPLSSLSIPTLMLGEPPIRYEAVPRGILRAFSRALTAAETTRSEKPMQEFFEVNPTALVSLIGPHRVWVFPRKTLGKPVGGSWQPDFLMCDWTSNGPEWTHHRA